MKKKTRIIVNTALLAGSAAVLAGTWLSITDRLDQANEIALVREEMETEQKQLESQIPASSSDLDDLYNQIVSKGTDVASLQTKYQQTIKDNTSDNMVAIGNELKPYFAQTLGATNWYSPDPDLVSASWKLVIPYDLGQDPVPVLWQMKEDDGTLLAWAQADYSRETGLFENIKFQHTSNAEKYLYPVWEESPESEAQKSLNRTQDFAAQIDEYNRAHGTDPSDYINADDYSDIMDARLANDRAHGRLD